MAKVKKKQSKPVSPERLMQFAWGYAFPLIIESAIRVRAFDMLADGAKTLDQVAKETGASTRGLAAIMNALASINLLKKTGNRYALTPESAAFLVSTRPAFRGGLFRHVSSQLMPKWLKLEEIVRSGKTAEVVNQQTSGTEFFEQLVEDIFPMSYMAAQTLAGALKVGKTKTPVRVLDIAAGSGVWGIAMAQASKQVHVTAVDWPGVLGVTRRTVAKFGLQDQFTFVEGDMHSADLGTGHHIATLGHILHSEGVRGSKLLIGRVFAALAPGGTIAISEFVADEKRSTASVSLIFAVNMLVNTTEGDTFTFKEIRSWLSEAGFKQVRELSAPAPSPLILATRPK